MVATSAVPVVVSAGVAQLKRKCDSLSTKICSAHQRRQGQGEKLSQLLQVENENAVLWISAPSLLSLKLTSQKTKHMHMKSYLSAMIQLRSELAMVLK